MHVAKETLQSRMAVDFVCCNKESLVMSQEQWWRVIEEMADFVACGFDYEELEDEWVHQALLAQGFTVNDIDKALDWLEMASISGSVADVFSMVLPVGVGMRVASPLEKVFVSEKIWSHLEDIRARGIIGDDLAERLLEGIRTLDTRDWEDEEVSSFIQEVVTSSLPSFSEKLIKRLCRKGASSKELYS
jgi:uncharacterized protein Smg (DUF494 family)